MASPRSGWLVARVSAALSVALSAAAGTAAPETAAPTKSPAPAKSPADAPPPAGAPVPTNGAQLPAAAPARAAAPPALTRPRAGPRRLVREGSFLTNRRGRLVRVGRDWTFEFDRDARGASEPTMLVQPGQRLTEMERLVESRAEAITFLVSGEVFVYRDSNYLLPLFFTVAPSAPAEQPPDAPPGAPEPGGGASGTAKNPSPADLLRGVERASGAPRSDRIRQDLESTGAGPSQGAGVRREGEFVNLRKARVIRTPAGQWQATFDNDPAGANPATPAANAPAHAPGAPAAAPTPDAPMILLPSQTLARMESLAERAPGGLTVTLSGQVFLYEGENYLLPTLFVVEYADVSELRTGQ